MCDSLFSLVDNMKIGIRCIISFIRLDHGRIETEHALLLFIAVLVCLTAMSVIDSQAIVIRPKQLRPFQWDANRPPGPMQKQTYQGMRKNRTPASGTFADSRRRRDRKQQRGRPQGCPEAT